VPLIDDLLPEFHFHEVHRRRIRATPPAAIAAARDVTLGEMRLVGGLFALRSFPGLIVRGRGLPRQTHRSLYDQMLEFGFVDLGTSSDEIVLGYVGQPWKLGGGSSPRLTRAGWKSFAEPGHVRAAMSFRAVGEGGTCMLETETRVGATDPASRRRFGRYWRVIRPGSGAIRWAWLRAAARRAEAVGVQ
jgi:hypothetical protein